MGKTMGGETMKRAGFLCSAGVSLFLRLDFFCLFNVLVLLEIKGTGQRRRVPLLKLCS